MEDAETEAGLLPGASLRRDHHLLQFDDADHHLIREVLLEDNQGVTLPDHKRLKVSTAEANIELTYPLVNIVDWA